MRTHITVHTCTYPIRAALTQEAKHPDHKHQRRLPAQLTSTFNRGGSTRAVSRRWESSAPRQHPRLLRRLVEGLLGSTIVRLGGLFGVGLGAFGDGHHGGSGPYMDGLGPIEAVYAL